MNHNSCGLCSIEMKNISVISGEDTLLDDVNLTFHCGELTALIGKNGAGKTTLLRTLLGERHYKGKISFTDHYGTVLPVPKIGYVPQHLDFDRSAPISVEDFLLVGRTNSPVCFVKNKKLKNLYLMGLTVCITHAIIRVFILTANFYRPC